MAEGKRAAQVFPRTNLQRNLSWATPGGIVPKKTWGSIFLLGIHLGNESIRGSKTQWRDQPKNFSLFSSEEMCRDISLVASAYRKLRNFLGGCIDSKCAKRMGGKLKPCHIRNMCKCHEVLVFAREKMRMQIQLVQHID